MKHSILSRFGSTAFLLLATLMCAAEPAAPANPFFAMDTALRDNKHSIAWNATVSRLGMR